MGAGRIVDHRGPRRVVQPKGWRTGVACQGDALGAASVQQLEGGPSVRSWSSAEEAGGLAEYCLSTHSEASWVESHAQPMGSLAAWGPSVGPILEAAAYDDVQRTGQG